MLFAKFLDTRPIFDTTNHYLPAAMMHSAGDLDYNGEAPPEQAPQARNSGVPIQNPFDQHTTPSGQVITNDSEGANYTVEGGQSDWGMATPSPLIGFSWGFSLKIV